MFSFAMENGNIIAISTTQLGKREWLIRISILNLIMNVFYFNLQIYYVNHHGKYSGAEEIRTAVQVYSVVQYCRSSIYGIQSAKALKIDVFHESNFQ